MSCGPFFSLGAGLGLFDRDVEDSGDVEIDMVGCAQNEIGILPVKWGRGSASRE